MTQQSTRYAILVAQHLYGVVLKHNLDVWCVEYSLLHSLRCTQERLSYDQVNLLADRGQIGSLLASGVTTTHYGYILLAVEETVASSAGTHAHTSKFSLRLQSEILRRCTCGNDEGLCLNLLLAVDGHNEWTHVEVDVCHDAEAYISTKTLCLLLQICHHRCACDTLWVAWEVLNLGCGCELSAWLNTLVEYRGKVGA